jgi:hypothetical protein
MMQSHADKAKPEFREKLASLLKGPQSETLKKLINQQKLKMAKDAAKKLQEKIIPTAFLNPTDSGANTLIYKICLDGVRCFRKVKIGKSKKRFQTHFVN